MVVIKEILSDLNAARECETICGSELFECVADCGANTECSSSCYRENIVCVDACPCHTGKYAPFPTNKQLSFKIVQWAANNAPIRFANLS